MGARASGEGVAPAGFVDWAKRKDDAAWPATREAIARAAPGGAVPIDATDLEPPARWQPRAVELRPLELDPVAPIALRARTTTSFTALVRGERRALAALAGPLATGRDVDAEVDVAPAPEPASPDLAADMHRFPRGADAGTLLHAVLEQADLAADDEAAVRRIAEACLARSALGAELVPQIVHVVRSVARTPLTAGPRPLRLGDLPRDRIRPELEFTLAAPGDGRSRGLTPEALARALAGAGPDTPLGRYAERARSLAWPALSGHLRGFIDAVFCDGERWYVVDYKSNHLGDRRDDYRPERLVAPMIEHDYVLQALLYVVALHRLLAVRLADYDYDRHMGGAYYLFLRGLAESHPPGCGVFFDRPDAAIVRAVSALIGDAGPEAR